MKIDIKVPFLRKLPPPSSGQARPGQAEYPEDGSSKNL
jgi:hypothetical protein